jgi:hypothetical protein
VTFSWASSAIDLVEGDATIWFASTRFLLNKIKRKMAPKTWHMNRVVGGALEREHVT